MQFKPRSGQLYVRQRNTGPHAANSQFLWYGIVYQSNRGTRHFSKNCWEIFLNFKHLSYQYSALIPRLSRFLITISFQACKNFYDDGVCKQECPPMQIYNPIKYKWERDPQGKYAYGATCVKECPEHLLKDNGACVRACPPKKKVTTLNIWMW